MRTWVTGSTNGLGKIIAGHLQGDVIRHGQQDGDLTNQNVVMNVVQSLQPLDAVVCCVGFKDHGNAFCDIALLKDMMEINLYTSVMCCQEVAKYMKYGNIITIGSVDGCFGKKDGVFYSMAKSALHTFTRCFAKELEGTGIKVNCIAPGTMKSDADRLQIASFVRYLVTENHGIHGQIIRIDKGHHTFPC